jgi:Type ISP C-terminal specificity domain/N-6 DNA Methylase
MRPVEQYLRDLSEIRSTGGGTKETSYYGPLEHLSNTIGTGRKPRVRCVMQLKSLGADHPDGGLFTADQYARKAASSPVLAQAPARGAVEAKATNENVDDIVDTTQVRKYLDRYNQVLVTNYRSFLLVGRDDDGNSVPGERYDLAPSESEFWLAAGDARATAAAHGVQLVEYLERVMLHPVPLTAPRDLAWFLASYARDARARIDRADMNDLATIRAGFEQALGLTFEGERGEHFFRSTLVQTLFYGLFSAWVLWTKTPRARRPFPTFSWKGAIWSLTVPMIRALFQEIVTPTQTSQLDLEDVLDWAEATLNRVDPDEFFKRFEEENAVQYFYEPFLEAFDPDLRKQLGVWYTPPEIVRYMVARVDTVLRSELGVADGLADPNVYVLDPCCGTGTYLVEILKHIHASQVANGMGALAGQLTKEAAESRVFGFEILPAPFVVSHLQLGLLLQTFGAPLAGTGARAGVYLTNALTGWEPPEGAKRKLPLREFEDERDAAEKVKRNTPILVVIGNPPYNAYAGTSPAEEHGLVEPYKSGIGETWSIKKYNLDDLYVRFFRIAERRIAEQTGKGVVSYISNFSYLRDPSFVVMRERLLREFDALWFDNLNGDSRETGKTTPDGSPDPSVFSTEQNREGIRVGTVVGLMVRKQIHGSMPTIGYRQLWGTNKRSELESSLAAPGFDTQYQVVTPSQANRYSFRPSAVSDDYYAWPRVDELAFTSPMPGLLEKRKGSLIGFDPALLSQRMWNYYDPSVTWNQLRALGTGLTQDAAAYDAQNVRQRLLTLEQFETANIRRMMLLPMDVRWCYHTLGPGLWNRARPDYSRQVWSGNGFLVARKRAVANPEGVPFFFTSVIADEHAFLKDAYYVPLMLRHEAPPPAATDGQADFLDHVEQPPPIQIANLSEAARAYLATLGITDSDRDMDTAALLWQHVLAIGYAPAYLAEHEDGIRADWPRIPLPATEDALRASAAVGKQLTALLDTEQPTTGVTGGAIRPELRVIADLANSTARRPTRALATSTSAPAGATPAPTASSWAAPASSRRAPTPTTSSPLSGRAPKRSV